MQIYSVYVFDIAIRTIYNKSGSGARRTFKINPKIEMKKVRFGIELAFGPSFGGESGGNEENHFPAGTGRGDSYNPHLKKLGDEIDIFTLREWEKEM